MDPRDPNGNFQFFASFKSGKACRFYKCSRGEDITPENVGERCEFQGGSLYEVDVPVQNLPEQAKFGILKQCVKGYYTAIKNCLKRDLSVSEEQTMLKETAWIEDCETESCKTLSTHISCSRGSGGAETCNVPPDPCFVTQSAITTVTPSQTSGSTTTPSSSANPSQTLYPEQEPGNGEEESSGSGWSEDDHDDKGRSDVFPGKVTGDKLIKWDTQVKNNMRSFLKEIDDADTEDVNDMEWSVKGKELFLMTLEEKPHVTLQDVFSTGMEGIRLSNILGKEIKGLQNQIESLQNWSWSFNLGLLLPTSLAVATSCLILGNFVIKTHKFLAEKVTRARSDLVEKRICKEEREKNLSALDMAVRLQSMRLQKDHPDYKDSGVITLVDGKGNNIGVYDPRVIPDQRKDKPKKVVLQLPLEEDSRASTTVSNLEMMNKFETTNEEKMMMPASAPTLSDITKNEVIQTQEEWEESVVNYFRGRDRMFDDDYA